MSCFLVACESRTCTTNDDYYFWVHSLGIFFRDSIHSVSLLGLGHSFCSAALGCQEPEPNRKGSQSGKKYADMTSLTVPKLDF